MPTIKQTTACARVAVLLAVGMFLFFAYVMPAKAACNVTAGCTGQTSFGIGQFIFQGSDPLRLQGTTSPTVGTIFATSTSATSTFNGPVNLNGTAVSILGEYFTNFTNYIRSRFSGTTPISILSGVISIADAVADGATKGAAAFTAADFNSAAGVISIDYTNGQKASGSQPGFLSSADWTTFNNKQPAGTYVTAITVNSSNGLAGSSSGGATPALTLSTTVTGIVKGNGTALSAAANGTDYTLITPLTCSAGQFFNSGTAAGVFTCGSPTGTGTGLGTTTPWNGSGVAYRVSEGAVSTAATTTLTGTGVISISNAPSVIGASPAVASITGGSNGQVLGWALGVPAWVASSSVAAGTGISISPSGAVTTVTNTGVISNSCPGGFLSCSGTNPSTFSLGTLTVANGGTGSSTLPISQILYGGANGTYQSRSTTTASCSGSVSCTSFDILGNTPITISGSGGSSFAYLFTPTPNFGTIMSATSSPIYDTVGLYASGTSVIGTTTFAADGSVGVGSSSPMAYLAVQNPFTTKPALHVTGSGSANVAEFQGTVGSVVTIDTNGQLSVDTIINHAQIATSNSAGTIPLTIQSSFGGGQTADLIDIKQNGGQTFAVFNKTGWEGIGTTTPYAKLSIHANANDTVSTNTLFAIGSSTNAATTTLFAVSNTGSTTAANGFNITAGCYAVNGTCLSTAGGGGGSPGGVATEVQYRSGASTFGAITSVYNATLSALGFGTTTLVTNPAVLTLGSSTPKGPLLSFSGGAGVPSYVISNQNGNLYIATSSDLSGATTSAISGLTLTSAGNVVLAGTTVSANGGELVLEENNDQFGTTRLRLQDRFGSNGIVVETNQAVADFGFNANGNPQNNIRWNSGSAGLNTAGEFEFELKGGNPYFSTGAVSSIVNSGLLGIGTTSPTQALSVQGNGLISGDIKLANLTATGTVSTANLTVTSVTGTQCLHAISGVVSGTGSDCGSGGAGNWFTPTSNFNQVANSSTTQIWLRGSPIALSASSTIKAAIVDVDQYSGYYQDSRLIGYASSTNSDTIFGIGAGNNATTSNSGSHDVTAVGFQALNAQSGTGFANNTGIGANALQINTTGSNNTALGVTSLGNNTTGSQNTAVGVIALRGAGLDLSNRGTALGYSAGTANTGDENLYVGYQAGVSNTSGYGNIYIGATKTSGGTNIATGFNNIQIGYQIVGTSTTQANFLNIGNILFGVLPATTTSSTFALPTSGTIGVGTSSPFAKLSVQANNGDTNKMLFAIGSSTAAATSTLFSVSNTGVASSSSMIVSSLGSAGTNCVQASTIGLLSALTTPCGTVTSVSGSGGTTGLTLTGGAITTSGTLTLGGTLAIANGGTNGTSFTTNQLDYFNGTSIVSASLTSIINGQGSLGFGTSTPAKNSVLTISSSTANQLLLTDSSATSDQWYLRTTGGTFYLGTSSPSTQASSTGVGITAKSQTATNFGIATSTWRTLGVTGTVAIDGLSAAAAGTVIVCIDSTTKELKLGASNVTCTPSTIDLKRDIATSTLGIDELMKIRTTTYYFKENEPQQQIGFIAQELQTVDMKLVHHNTDGSIAGAQLDAILAVAVKSIQEIAVHQDNTDERLAALEQKVDSLQNQNVGLKYGMCTP